MKLLLMFVLGIITALVWMRIINKLLGKSELPKSTLDQDMDDWEEYNPPSTKD